LVPSKRLLELLKQPFSEDFLKRLVEELGVFTPLTHNGRIAVFIARHVAAEVASMMSVVEPTTARHDAIQTYLQEPLGEVVAKLANFLPVSNEELVALIQASENVRFKT
jgi:hypothetical protein